MMQNVLLQAKDILFATQFKRYLLKKPQLHENIKHTLAEVVMENVPIYRRSNENNTVVNFGAIVSVELMRVLF